jgi:superfamily II DNA/RNA helicase
VALRDLGPWLVQLPGFVKQLEKVTIDAACNELGPKFARLIEHSVYEHDWAYLLLSASVLAQSDDGICQEAALRIAQTCLSDDRVSARQRDSAALVLDALANHPAITLSERRSYLEPGFVTRLPGSARIEYSRRSYDDSVEVQQNTRLRVNRFQRKLWDQLHSQAWVSVSAPTSAGKSFIITRWISELIRTFDLATVVYLVPTRALISQVEGDLRDLFAAEGLDDVSVSSLPVLPKGDDNTAIRKRVFVLTQERLHILLSTYPNLSANALIVDEAHKMGDAQRGVLLQDVVERICEVNRAMQVVFASPMTSNPGILLADVDHASSTDPLASLDVTVTQNLFWMSQQRGKPKSWNVSLWDKGIEVELGRVALTSTPNSPAKRLSFIAFAVGGGTHGNVVYVNGAAEAEKIAEHLVDLIGVDAEGNAANDLQALADLAQHVVHKRFALATCLKRGVAFHYGNMPLLIREEIERLFSAGTIKFLVCTSTLIEGVNMACRNIFMRGPQKGRGKALSLDDFWNLAGRAGRWGKEFQGNIFCIDPKLKQWGALGPPRKRTQQKIERTTDNVLLRTSELIQFIEAETPLEVVKKHPELEHVFAYLASVRVRYGSLLEAPWSRRFDDGILTSVDNTVATAMFGFAVDSDVIARNQGISPFALDDLLMYFRKREGPVEELLPTDPADEDASNALMRVFGRLSKRACPKLGPAKRSFSLAILVTQWMRGYSLSRLIDERLKRLGKKGALVDEAGTIRSVMEDVEQIARFEAPRGLSCYCDVLQQHLREVGREELFDDLPKFNVLLELGVSLQTQVSLMGLGLSRTSAIAISEKITADDFTEVQALRWILDNSELWQNFSVPALVKKEIERVVAQHRSRGVSA